MTYSLPTHEPVLGPVKHLQSDTTLAEAMAAAEAERTREEYNDSHIAQALPLPLSPPRPTSVNYGALGM